MEVSLNPEMENLIREKIESGFYKSAADVINRSLRLLQKYDEEKLQALREDILQAHYESERGESMPLDCEAIESIKLAGRARLKNQPEETR